MPVADYQFQNTFISTVGTASVLNNIGGGNTFGTVTVDGAISVGAGLKPALPKPATQKQLRWLIDAPRRSAEQENGQQGIPHKDCPYQKLFL